MKTRTRQKVRQFQLQIMAYGNSYYIERIAKLESLLAQKPQVLEIELIGVGEVLADFGLIIRAALLKRSPKTRIITNARSSLQGASVLVWLMGDSRNIREDAKLYFRKANLPNSEDETQEDSTEWKEKEPSFWDSPELDPEEGDYARVLQLIDEFLPVKEMAGRLIGVPELRQFGLVENEKVDQFLATALGHRPAPRQRAVKKRHTGPKLNGSRPPRPTESPPACDFTI